MPSATSFSNTSSSEARAETPASLISILMEPDQVKQSPGKFYALLKKDLAVILKFVRIIKM